RLTNSKGLPMGTPFYMSPEASQGLEMTGLSDQYALGVVLYESATGTNPFSGASTFGEVVRQVTTGDYPPVATRNPKLSKRMIAIIERAMHLDPHRRFPDMRAMGRELLGLAGQRTRITWGLSFSEIAQAAGADSLGAPLPPVLPRRESQRPPGANGKNRYLAPMALVALAVAAAVWMNWPKPEAQPLATNQPAVGEEPTSQVMDLRGRTTNVAATDVPGEAVPGTDPVEQPQAPTPTEEPVAERTARGLSEPIGEARGEAAPEEPAAPPAKEPKEQGTGSSLGRGGHALALNQPARSNRVARTGGGRRNNVARPPVTAPNTDAAGAASSAETSPDWKISSRQSTRSNRGPDRGTNNAPILD
ncbi:MAG: protein kinase, partial [Deltaproteobacteria bacterium]